MGALVVGIRVKSTLRTIYWNGREQPLLKESIRIVLARGELSSMSSAQIAKAIQEDDNLYDLSGSKTPNESVRGKLSQNLHLFVRTGPSCYKLNLTQS